MRLLSFLLGFACAAASAPSPAYRLRVEYLDSPLTVDVTTPRFSWALAHADRAQYQTAYHLTVATVGGATVWDTGVVTSNTSLNIPYGGTALQSDTDYLWTLAWTDAAGTTAPPATATFSTGLLSPAAWNGAEYVSSTANGSLNTYRAEFTLAALPARARLFIVGLVRTVTLPPYLPSRGARNSAAPPPPSPSLPASQGYYKALFNGELTDDHERGIFPTFEQRVLYDVVDVTPRLRVGCNALGVMLGHGWFSQPKVHSGPRQFMMLLSLTDAAGAVTYLHSASAAAPGALTFTATAGPVQLDDVRCRLPAARRRSLAPARCLLP